MQKEKKWITPFSEFDDNDKPAKKPKKNVCKKSAVADEKQLEALTYPLVNNNHKNWMKKFDPVTAEDLAVHNKKLQEVEEWLQAANSSNNSDMLLLTGPVGSGKTITMRTLAAKYKIKVTEWITPLDIDIPSEYGDYEYKEKHSTKFLDFIIKAANFTSLLDNNSKKMVLVEDFPNTFIRTPSEFTDVLQQYRRRGKSPLVFICSESHTDNKNSAANLFTPNLKEQFQIHHVTFNAVSSTGLKSALKRVAEIINKKHTAMYNIPTADMIDCVVNSSVGDVRSAVLTLHFACLKGSNQNLETSLVAEKENNKSKNFKVNNKKKKQASSKFSTLGKDQTVSILHGVGRVLNPKVTENGQFTHPPKDIIEQFISQPSSFVNFLEENYLPHFSCPDHVDNAASALSDADFMLAEWREKICQENGLYTAVAGMMLANKAPLSAWNPVKGPKSMKIQYPTPREIPLLEENYLYKGKILVTDYQTYCKIIASKSVNPVNGV